MIFRFFLTDRNLNLWLFGEDFLKSSFNFRFFMTETKVLCLFFLFYIIVNVFFYSANFILLFKSCLSSRIWISLIVKNNKIFISFHVLCMKLYYFTVPDLEMSHSLAQHLLPNLLVHMKMSLFHCLLTSGSTDATFHSCHFQERDRW